MLNFLIFFHKKRVFNVFYGIPFSTSMLKVYLAIDVKDMCMDGDAALSKVLGKTAWFGLGTGVR